MNRSGTPEVREQSRYMKSIFGEGEIFKNAGVMYYLVGLEDCMFICTQAAVGHELLVGKRIKRLEEVAVALELQFTLSKTGESAVLKRKKTGDPSSDFIVV